MVLLPAPAILNPEAGLRQMREYCEDTPSVIDMTTEDGVTVAQIPGGAVGMVLISAPVPPGDLEGPTAVAWHWPTAGEAIARHASHVIVHAGSSTLDLLDLRLLHTRFVAAVAETTGAIGVYVGGAMLVRAADDYVAEARMASHDNLPLLCWLGVNPVREEDGSASGYTTGMHDLGFLELEIRRSERPVTEVLGVLADAASYQLTTGKRLGDGETFGFSETDRRRIRHTRSAFLPDTTVVSIES